MATFGEPAEPRLFNRITISERHGTHGYELRGEIAWHHSADRYATPEEAEIAGAAALVEANRAADREVRRLG